MLLAWSSLNYRLRKMNAVCRKIALTESNRAAAAAVGLDVLGDEEEVFVPGGPAAQHGCHGRNYGEPTNTELIQPTWFECKYYVEMLTLLSGSTNNIVLSSYNQSNK